MTTVPPRSNAAWAEVPTLPLPPHRPLRPVERELLALVVAVAGPVLRSQQTDIGQPFLTLAVGVAASMLLAVVPERFWPVRLAVPIIAAVVLLEPEGQLVAVWMAAGLALSDWVVRRRRPLPRVPATTPGALAPVLLLLGLAAWRGRDSTVTVGVVVFVGLAVVAATVSSLGGGRVDRAAAAIGRVVGSAVSRMVFILLGLLVIPVPWVLRRLFRVDPLDGPLGKSQWVPRARTSLQVAQPWAPDAAVLPSTASRRLRSSLVTFAGFGVVVLGLAGVLAVGSRLVDRSPSAAGSTTSPEAVPAAYEGEDWYPEYREDIDWIIQQTRRVAPAVPSPSRRRPVASCQRRERLSPVVDPSRMWPLPNGHGLALRRLDDLRPGPEGRAHHRVRALTCRVGRRSPGGGRESGRTRTHALDRGSAVRLGPDRRPCPRPGAVLRRCERAVGSAASRQRGAGRRRGSGRAPDRGYLAGNARSDRRTGRPPWGRADRSRTAWPRWTRRSWASWPSSGTSALAR